jgi:hypothetical protein
MPMQDFAVLHRLPSALWAGDFLRGKKVSAIQGDEQGVAGAAERI